MTLDEGRRWGEAAIIVHLAGHRAERRARGCSYKWQVAVHEAGHVVAARMAGHWVGEAAIYPEAPIKNNGAGYRDGHVVTAAKPIQKPVDEIRPAMTENEWATCLVALLIPSWNWRTILAGVREYQHRTDELLTAHWPAVQRIAGALLDRGRLSEEEIERLIAV